MEQLLVGHCSHVSVLCKYIDNKLTTLCAYDHKNGYPYRIEEQDFDAFLESSFFDEVELLISDIISHHHVSFDDILDVDQLVAFMSHHISPSDINFSYVTITGDDNSFIVYGHANYCTVTFFDRELNIGSTFKRCGVFIEFPTNAAHVSHIAIPFLKLSDEDCFTFTKINKTAQSIIGQHVLVI